MSEEKFETWAVIELFGHNIIAGKVSEQTIGSQTFIRVDVPEVDGQPEFTKFLGGGAIYSITPTSEELARLVAGRKRVKPVNIYDLPQAYLPSPDPYEEPADDSPF